MTNGTPVRLGQKSIFIKILKLKTDVFLLITLFYCMIYLENIILNFLKQTVQKASQ